MYFILTLIFCFSLSCEKENQPSVDKQMLIGEWVNLVNDNDTLRIDEAVIKRIDVTQGKYSHFYDYELVGNYITLQYTGLDEILVEATKLKVSFSQTKSNITFEGLSSYYPNYEGDTFRIIKQK